LCAEKQTADKNENKLKLKRNKLENKMLVAQRIFAQFSPAFVAKSLVGHVQMTAQGIFRSFVLIINCRPLGGGGDSGWWENNFGWFSGWTATIMFFALLRSLQ